jgi:lipoate-protein ligase A
MFLQNIVKELKMEIQALRYAAHQSEAKKLFKNVYCESDFSGKRISGCAMLSPNDRLGRLWALLYCPPLHRFSETLKTEKGFQSFQVCRAVPVEFIWMLADHLRKR